LSSVQAGNVVDFNGSGLEPNAQVYICNRALALGGCVALLGGNLFPDGTFVGSTSCYVGDYLETTTATGAAIESNPVTACL
jgi:hypothetical protein